MSNQHMNLPQVIELLMESFKSIPKVTGEAEADLRNLYKWQGQQEIIQWLIAQRDNHIKSSTSPKTSSGRTMKVGS